MDLPDASLSVRPVPVKPITKSPQEAPKVKKEKTESSEKVKTKLSPEEKKKAAEEKKRLSAEKKKNMTPEERKKYEKEKKRAKALKRTGELCGHSLLPLCIF